MDACSKHRGTGVREASLTDLGGTVVVCAPPPRPRRWHTHVHYLKKKIRPLTQLPFFKSIRATTSPAEPQGRLHSEHYLDGR